jgi:hypothetical protein
VRLGMQPLGMMLSQVRQQRRETAGIIQEPVAADVNLLIEDRGDGVLGVGERTPAHDVGVAGGLCGERSLPEVWVSHQGVEGGLGDSRLVVPVVYAGDLVRAGRGQGCRQLLRRRAGRGRIHEVGEPAEEVGVRSGEVDGKAVVGVVGDNPSAQVASGGVCEAPVGTDDVA